MQHFEIPLPEQAECAAIEAAIDHALSATGLTVTLRDTLKKYPGCIHWHARSSRRPGTLEITLWPQKHRAWLTIQSGRRAEWIEAKRVAIAEAILRELLC